MSEQYFTPNQIRAASQNQDHMELRNLISSIIDGTYQMQPNNGMQSVPFDYQNTGVANPNFAGNEYNPAASQNMTQNPGGQNNNGVGGVSNWQDYRPPMTEEEIDIREKMDSPFWRSLGMICQGINNAELNPIPYAQKAWANITGKPYERNQNVMEPRNKFEKVLLNGSKEAYNVLASMGMLGASSVPRMLAAGAASTNKLIKWPSKIAQFLTSTDAAPVEVGSVFGANALSEYANIEPPAENAGWDEKLKYLAKTIGVDVAGGVAGGLGGGLVNSGSKMLGNGVSKISEDLASRIKNSQLPFDNTPHVAYAGESASVPTNFNSSVNNRPQSGQVFYNDSSKEHFPESVSADDFDSSYDVDSGYDLDDDVVVDENISGIKWPGKKSVEKKSWLAQMPHNRLTAQEMEDLKKYNQYFEGVDVANVDRAYDEIARDPTAGNPMDHMFQMDLFDGRKNLLMNRGAVIFDRYGQPITSGARLKHAKGTNRNFGLSKMMYKHDLTKEDVENAVRGIRSHWPLREATNSNGMGHYYILDSLRNDPEKGNIPLNVITRELNGPNGGNPMEMFVSAYHDPDYPYRVRSLDIYNPTREGRVFKKMGIGSDGREREIWVNENDIEKFYKEKYEIKKKLEEAGIPIEYITNIKKK